MVWVPTPCSSRESGANMNCTNSSFQITRAAAIVTLIQGVIWTILSIVGLLLYECKIAVPNNGSTAYLVYLVYFFNTDCAVPPGFLKIIQNEWPLEPVFPAQRTFCFAISTLVVNIVWVGLSITLLFKSTEKISKTKYAVVCHFSWIIITVGVLIMDVVAVSLYSLDLVKISKAGGLLRILGVSHLGENWQQLIPTNYYDHPEAPTAILLPMASRFFPLLWLTDLTLLFMVARSTRHFVKGETCKDETKQDMKEEQEETRKLNIEQLQEDQEQEDVHETLYENEQTEPAIEEDYHIKSVKETEFQKNSEQNYKTNFSIPYPINKDQGSIDVENIPNISSDSETSQTSDQNQVRLSILNRLSSMSQTPQGLQNQVPWSYLGKSPNILKEFDFPANDNVTISHSAEQ